jgi:hypothetical protein
MPTRLNVSVKIHKGELRFLGEKSPASEIKKDLPIKQGESIQDYARAVSESARSVLTGKFNIAKGKGDVYVCEIYQSSVIFEVCKYEASDPKDRYRTYAATYKRADDGSFTFGDTPQEVQRVVRYEAVSTPTTKSGNSLFAGLL